MNTNQILAIGVFGALGGFAMAPALAQSANPAAAPAAAPAKYDGIQAGPVNIKFGGFVEFAGIYRSRNIEADMGSNYTAIPFPNASGYYLNEFRESARQSRITIQASGPNDGHHHAEAYYEMDFLGAAQTANSKESNSYTPRIRNIYGQYFNDDTGFSMLAGQNWSLVTLEKKGIIARNELAPSTIEAQYVPGFNWTRNSQLRFVKKFNGAVSGAVSFESPQALFAGKAPNGVIVALPAGSQFNSANTLTFDGAPDIIAKVAFDPAFGHYELFGMSRSFKDRSVGSATVTGANHTASGTGFGGSVYVPLAPGKAEFQASFLTGQGIGRYGSAQLPDATYDSTGGVRTVKGTTMLAGLLLHPTSAVDLYAYWGQEKVDATYSAVTGGYVGYGAPNIDLSGCGFETGTCAPNAGKVSQGTIGGWWKVYRGPIGYVQLGLQASSTKLAALSGLNGSAPSTTLNIGLLSVRYYPYQN